MQRYLFAQPQRNTDKPLKTDNANLAAAPEAVQQIMAHLAECKTPVGGLFARTGSLGIPRPTERIGNARTSSRDTPRSRTKQSGRGLRNEGYDAPFLPGREGFNRAARHPAKKLAAMLTAYSMLSRHSNAVAGRICWPELKPVTIAMAATASNPVPIATDASRTRRTQQHILQ